MLQLFMSLIALISLFIAFFLLMISTTQNVHEAVWEYGVLRSIGVTKDQGQRIFMYEAFMVIISAGLLGFLVGLCVSTMVTAQFYLFIELPFVLEWPVWILLLMMVISLATTYLAVYIPIKQVNQANIASILKGSA